MFRKLFCCAAVAALVVTPSITIAHELGAHVHGVANLEIAVDQNTLTLDLSSPLDNLIGFEHQPRTAQQKAAVRTMADNFNKAEQYFVPSPEAGCMLQSAKLDSPALIKNKSAKSENGDRVHADLDGEFVFACKQTDKLHDLEVKLFASYPNLHKLNVEIAALRTQAAATLTSAQPRASW
jgi:Protein of unknown function (DUF2796)